MKSKIGKIIIIVLVVVIVAGAFAGSLIILNKRNTSKLQTELAKKDEVYNALKVEKLKLEEENKTLTDKINIMTKLSEETQKEIEKVRAEAEKTRQDSSNMINTLTQVKLINSYWGTYNRWDEDYENVIGESSYGNFFFNNLQYVSKIEIAFFAKNGVSPVKVSTDSGSLAKLELDLTRSWAEGNVEVNNLNSAVYYDLIITYVDGRTETIRETIAWG